MNMNTDAVAPVTMQAQDATFVPAPQVDQPVKLEIRDLRFKYQNGHEVLKGINIKLRDKTVTAFIGPSGCGKSTLLRTFNRMYDLYPGQEVTGEILLDGRNILRAGRRPEPAALQGRDGVPETDALPDVDL